MKTQCIINQIIMKKITVLIILAFIIHTQVSSQSCLPYGINIDSQIEIDSFQINFPGCTEIGGSVMISDPENNSITNLNGLSVLTSIGGYLIISGNNTLNSFSGLENLISIGGGLEINYNNMLTDISALSNVSSIGGDFQINSNNSLTSLQGLNNVISIYGFAKVFSNDVLLDLSDLNSLSSVEDLLMISGNPQITNLNGLESLTTIGERLIVAGNLVLENLNGLDNLTSIGGLLFIWDNDALINIQGLINVTSIGGEITIRKNVTLRSLDGIDNISSGSIERLSILLNDSLSTCEVKSICNYLANPTGDITIFGNATGCANELEVTEACLVGISENIETEFIIYPNPAKNIITISNKLNKTIDIINIYNQLGQEVIHLKDIPNVINISSLNQGIYIIELSSNEFKIRKILIIE